MSACRSFFEGRKPAFLPIFSAIPRGAFFLILQKLVMGGSPRTVELGKASKWTRLRFFRSA